MEVTAQVRLVPDPERRAGASPTEAAGVEVTSVRDEAGRRKKSE